MMMLPVILALTLLVPASMVSARSFDGIPGSFCGSRPRGCCTDRRDDCSVPIDGTRCYCDDFCDRRDDDCCPDFFYVCRNITTEPPVREELVCLHKGLPVREGEILRVNCNNCRYAHFVDPRYPPLQAGVFCLPEEVDTADPRNVHSDFKINKCQRMGYTMELMCEQKECMIDPTVLSAINEDRYGGWKATNYSKFWGQTLDMGLARRTGTLHSRRKVYSMRPLKQVFDRKRLPLSYDLRLKRPGLISPPLDQGWCASSWVMSTVGVATDRLALLSQGADRDRLSPQHLLSCNFKNQRGCDGGHLTRAWNFIKKFGLVPEECYPWTGTQTLCTVPKIRNRNITMARCSSGNTKMVLHRAGPAYRVDTEEGIMYEIMSTGPVQATMKVNHDFFMYRNGVYQCSKLTSSHRTSFHSVRIVGWGEERQWGGNVKYWIAANSWGQDWGENGYFRIKRGTNECQIESFVIAALINPVTSKLDPMSMFLPDRNNRFSNRI